MMYCFEIALCVRRLHNVGDVEFRPETDTRPEPEMDNPEEIQVSIVCYL